jgi:hypothetical protein
MKLWDIYKKSEQYKEYKKEVVEIKEWEVKEYKGAYPTPSKLIEEAEYCCIKKFLKQTDVKNAVFI